MNRKTEAVMPSMTLGVQFILAMVVQWVSVVFGMLVCDAALLPLIERGWLAGYTISRDTVRSRDLAVYLLAYCLATCIINFVIVSHMWNRFRCSSRMLCVAAGVLSALLGAYLYMLSLRTVAGRLPIVIDWEARAVYAFVGLVVGALFVRRNTVFDDVDHRSTRR